MSSYITIMIIAMTLFATISIRNMYNKKKAAINNDICWRIYNAEWRIWYDNGATGNMPKSSDFGYVSPRKMNKNKTP